MFELIPKLIMIMLFSGLSLVVMIRIIYELIKKKRNSQYKSEYLSDALKIGDPTTGLPKNMINKTQADDYLREARNMEQKKSVIKDIEDF